MLRHCRLVADAVPDEMDFIPNTPSEHLQKAVLAIDSTGGVVRVCDQKHSQAFAGFLLIVVGSLLQLLVVWLFRS